MTKSSLKTIVLNGKFIECNIYIPFYCFISMIKKQKISVPQLPYYKFMSFNENVSPGCLVPAFFTEIQYGLNLNLLTIRRRKTLHSNYFYRLSTRPKFTMILTMVIQRSGPITCFISSPTSLSLSPCFRHTHFLNASWPSKYFFTCHLLS